MIKKLELCVKKHKMKRKQKKSKEENYNTFTPCHELQPWTKQKKIFYLSLCIENVTDSNIGNKNNRRKKRESTQSNAKEHHEYIYSSLNQW